jgi:hypothetical protein
LDFLGDIGGFQGALILIFFILGEYFSGKFLLAAIAENLYKQKNKKQ